VAIVDSLAGTTCVSMHASALLLLLLLLLLIAASYQSSDSIATNQRTHSVRALSCFLVFSRDALLDTGSSRTAAMCVDVIGPKRAPPFAMLCGDAD